AGVVSQLVTVRLRASRVFALGTISMLVGLVLLVTAVRLSTPSLALFLVSGGLIGAGAGAVFKGTTGLVLDGTAPENRVAMAAENESHAEALALDLGPLARAASVEYAIATAGVVVFALWLDDMKDVIAEHADLLERKVIVDPSNPVGFDANGQIRRTLPDDQ